MANTLRISEEIARKIRQVEIYTRRLLIGSMVGDTRSAIKGTGYEFDQIREYLVGDDIRFIDWNASARMNTLLIKQYVEERSRTVFLAVDVSKSEFFGSTHTTKRDVAAQLASALALVASHGSDRVGLILFSDEVEYVLPPGQGTHHVHALMEAVFSYEPKKDRTQISAALAHLARLKVRDGIVFLISDFIDSDFSTYLPVVARKYDCIAVRCLDERETSLPPVGFLAIEDIETGQEVVIDARSGGARVISDYLGHRVAEQNKLFRKYGIDVLEVAENRPFIADLVRFFRRRMRY